MPSELTTEELIATIRDHAARLLRVGESDRTTPDEARSCVADSEKLAEAAARLERMQAVIALCQSWLYGQIESGEYERKLLPLLREFTAEAAQQAQQENTR